MQLTGGSFSRVQVRKLYQDRLEPGTNQADDTGGLHQRQSSSDKKSSDKNSGTIEAECSQLVLVRWCRRQHVRQRSLVVGSFATYAAFIDERI